MRASSRRHAAKTRRWRLLLAGAVSGASACTLSGPGLGQGPPTPDLPTAAVTRLNMTGRALKITAPLLLRDVTLGEVEMTVAPDDTISLPPERLLDLLAMVVEPKTMSTLRAALSALPSVGPGDLAGSDISIVYDAQALALQLVLPDTLRAARDVQLGSMTPETFGTFDPPASTSAYVNARLSWDHVARGEDTGFADPVLFMDGAARIGGVVLETEGVWQPGALTSDLQRHGTRLVYDDVESVVRWTLGDVLTLAEGFQTSLPLAGIMVQRSYGLLRPHQSVRPTGRQSFVLRRPSTVEVLVNGQLVRRVRLDPGPYSLSDFPTTYGANDVRLNITDDTGRTETLRFNLFFDQDQLTAGRSEFALHAGLKAPRPRGGINYTNEWAASGYYRRGISEQVTLGVNAQAEAGTSVGGLEAIWVTPFGILAGQAAISRSSGTTGVAGIATFQRDFPWAQGWGGTLNLTAELWTNRFTAPETSTVEVPFKQRIGASYSQSFGEALYAAIDVQHSSRMGDGPDPFMIRGSVGWRLTPDINLAGDFFHQRNVSSAGNESGARLILTVRLGGRSSVQSSYDTAYGTSRLSYQRSEGEGVGAYSAGADLEHSASGTNANGNLSYTSNRAEFALSHLSSFGKRFELPRDARTNIRAAASLAFADGAVAFGRPVQDSFAIVTAHESLGGAEVVVDPTEENYTAATDSIGPALKPNLSSYSESTVAIAAPDAPIGIDLGRGSYRLFPPYRSGYRFQVGSEYSISASGRLLGLDGQPLALIAGEATELAKPERGTISVFTNAAGRFGLYGLRPGRWRIEMLTEPALSYSLEVPEGTGEVLNVGDLKPNSEAR